MKAIPTSHFRLLVCTLGLAGGLLPLPAQIPWATDEFSRRDKFEVYGTGQYLHQGDTEFSDPYLGNVKMKLNDTGLGGIGLAYHFNDFLAVHADFMIGPATFSASAPNVPPYKIGDDGFIQSGRFNVDYNILNRRLTPFITAGIGYQYMQVDQNHYGYYDYYDYYYETDFTWNVGAGLRWNITDNLFIKVTGGAQWLQYEGANNITTQLEAFLAIGGTFP